MSGDFGWSVVWAAVEISGPRKDLVSCSCSDEFGRTADALVSIVVD